MKNLKGSLILFTAAFFWGTTFVAQVNGSDHLGVFTYNASRSFVVFLFLLIVALLNDNRKKATTGTATAPSKWPVRGGILCGIVLFFAMATQQTGISLYPKQVAAAGRSGFLTAIYVVIVAVIVAIAGKKLQGFVVISVIGTVCGMYLLCLKDGFSGIYIGDLFGLVCAFCFAGHILVVDHYNQADCIKLSCLQFLTAGTLSLLSCLFIEQIIIKDIIAAAPAIFYAGIFSSGVAYTLQMVGQKYTKPAIASIVMSLESVIAVVAGAIVLHEVLSGREILGCTIVFASVILAQIPGFLKKTASE